jgi:hypothetical protein
MLIFQSCTIQIYPPFLSSLFLIGYLFKPPLLPNRNNSKI